MAYTRKTEEEKSPYPYWIVVRIRGKERSVIDRTFGSWILAKQFLSLLETSGGQGEINRVDKTGNSIQMVDMIEYKKEEKVEPEIRSPFKH